MYGREEFWKKIDQELQTLLTAAREEEGWTRAWGSRLADARTDLAYYRMEINQTLAAESAEKSKEYSDETRRRMETFHAAIKAGENLPGNFGVKAREISALIANTLKMIADTARQKENPCRLTGYSQNTATWGAWCLYL
jgi:recombinational DNA repair ATPase RecF